LRWEAPKNTKFTSLEEQKQEKYDQFALNKQKFKIDDINFKLEDYSTKIDKNLLKNQEMKI